MSLKLLALVCFRTTIAPLSGMMTGPVIHRIVERRGAE